MLTDNVPYLYISGVGHPKYYIPENVNIVTGDYGQYVIHERGRILIDGSLELGFGAQLIVLEAE